MKIKRSSKYTLKFITKKKRLLLEQMFDLYKVYLQRTIDLIWEEKVPVKKYISSKEINWMDNVGGQYKQIIYRHACAIVKSIKSKKGKKSKPEVKNLTISLDRRIVNVEFSNRAQAFDRWIRISLPFILEGKKRERIEIFIPLKEHKHSLKFKDWRLCKTIRLNKDFVYLTFEKEKPPVKQEGKVIGIDQGYKNLITTSEGQFIGKGFNRIYEKIARKKQGSKAFKRALVERNNEINRLINKELDLSDVKTIKIEDLKYLKKGIKGRFRKEFNNKFQRWTYRQVMTKLERKAEQEAVQLFRVQPAFTSLTCPMCLFRHKDNRKSDKFLCLNCGYENHSDVVGAINIARQEPIVPVAHKQILEDRNKCP